jgi:hypothetical protein
MSPKGKSSASSSTTPNAPSVPPIADVRILGVHLLALHLRALPGSPPDPHDSDYGFRIYWGVFPPGGASVRGAQAPAEAGFGCAPGVLPPLAGGRLLLCRSRGSMRRGWGIRVVIRAPIDYNFPLVRQCG